MHPPVNAGEHELRYQGIHRETVSDLQWTTHQVVWTFQEYIHEGISEDCQQSNRDGDVPSVRVVLRDSQPPQAPEICYANAAMGRLLRRLMLVSAVMVSGTGGDTINED